MPVLAHGNPDILWTGAVKACRLSGSPGPMQKTSEKEPQEPEGRVVAAILPSRADGAGMWDRADGFYRDLLPATAGHQPVKPCSMVGSIPLFAVETLEPARLTGVVSGELPAGGIPAEGSSLSRRRIHGGVSVAAELVRRLRRIGSDRMPIQSLRSRRRWLSTPQRGAAEYSGCRSRAAPGPGRRMSSSGVFDTSYFLVTLAP